MSVVYDNTTLVRECIHVFFGSGPRNTPGGWGRGALPPITHEAGGVCEHGYDEGWTEERTSANGQRVSPSYEKC